jgi:N-dimethylarginine dimethylaminohydrolase
MPESKHVLMCAPEHFDIEYEINPWMDTDNQVDQGEAQRQWQQLTEIYKKLHYQIELIEPSKGLPDMVFTANGGLVIDGKVMLPRFKYRERQPETPLFAEWFQTNGFPRVHMPKNHFEGEGDALVFGDVILAGWGFRSDREAHRELENFFGRTVISLHLVNENFYHLDTCLTILDDKTLAYFPGAFDETSRKALELVSKKLIEVDEEDAKAFGLNAVSDGENVILSDRAQGLIKQLRKEGFKPHPTSTGEFQKSGGGVKCLTLELRR